MTVKIVVARKYPKNATKFAAQATEIANGMNANPYFANPPVASPALFVLIAAYIAADGDVKKSVPDAVVNREAIRAKLEVALNQDEAYVEGILRSASPEDAAKMLASSGFPQRLFTAYVKPAWSVGKGPTAGTVRVDIKLVGRRGTVQYCIEYSPDKGTTWIEVPYSNDSVTIVPGLTIGAQLTFRFRTYIKRVYGDWSQSLAYTVH